MLHYAAVARHSGCTARTPRMDLRERPNSPENQCSIGFQPVFCPIERRFPKFHRSSGMCTKIRVSTLGNNVMTVSPEVPS